MRRSREGPARQILGGIRRAGLLETEDVTAARVGAFVSSRQSRRELRAVLDGHHGSAMREELLARLDGGREPAHSSRRGGG